MTLSMDLVRGTNVEQLYSTLSGVLRSRSEKEFVITLKVSPRLHLKIINID